MKLNYKKIQVALFLLGGTIIGLSSCLKDKEFDNYSIQAVAPRGDEQKIISVATTVKSSDEFIAYAVDASTKDTTISIIPVVLNSADMASQDIHVTMVPDTAYLNAYNTVHGTTYIMPTTKPAFTLVDGGVVTIKAGTNTGYVQVKVKTADFLGGSYAFAYKIGSVAESGYTISGNHKSSIAAILAKNQWDGLYTMKGYTLRAGDAVKTGNFAPVKMELQTSGSNSVAFGTLQVWADGTGVGIGNPVLSISSTNAVTITSTGGATNAPGYTSRYDPAKRQFYISFAWGAWPSFKISN